MKDFIKHIQKRAIVLTLLLVIILTAVCAILIVMVKNQYVSNIDNLEQDTLNTKNDQYQTILYNYRQLAQTYYERIESDNRILEILWKANTATNEERDVLREDLIALSTENYNNAIKYYFRQYHFVLKDNTSFLRMQKPEKFGDDLTGVRNSVEIANKEERYVEGFEEGRISNGYRFEFPLFFQEESIGCVEISLSFASITKLMSELFDTKCGFLIKKSIVDEKVWEELLDQTYESVPFTQDYYLDMETKETSISDESSIFNLLDNDSIIKNTSLLNGDSLFIHFKYDNKDYGFVFLSIENIVNDHAGYLMFVDECTHMYAHRNSYYTQIVMIIILWLIIASIIVILVKNRINIERVSFHDKLTGVFNRNILYTTIDREMERDKRHNSGLSLILIDVDNFKYINDTYGHMNGDKVLRGISKTIMQNIRATDIIFRYGGDEFLILLPHIDTEEAIYVANKINKLVGETKWEEVEKKITLSMGVVQYDKKENIEEIIIRADKMLYNAKENGKNNVCS